jgi:hypothetical protein
MNRRRFLRQAVSLLQAAIARSSFAGALPAVSNTPEVRVTLDPAQTLAVIPPDFISPAGWWKPTRIEEVSGTRSRLQVRVPAASAAIVTLHT